MLGARVGLSSSAASHRTRQARLTGTNGARNMASMASFFSRIIGAGLVVSLLAAPASASAQDTVDETRLRRIGAEVRALQRKVFPGGEIGRSQCRERVCQYV